MDDLTVKLVSFAMNVAEHKQRIATLNIANANNPQAKPLEVNFAELINKVASNTGTARESLLHSIGNDWSQHKSNSVTEGAKTIELDEEVAKSMLASGEYRGLAEGVSRKLGLYKVAITGGK